MANFLCVFLFYLDFQFSRMSTGVGCGRLADGWFENNHSETFDIGCSITTSHHTQYKHHQESLRVAVDAETIHHADAVRSNFKGMV